MGETIATNYAKAIDDMSGKIFIPGLIASLIVELGPWFQEKFEVNSAEIYVSGVLFGFIISGLILYFLGAIDSYFKGNGSAAPVIAIAIMPIGFAALFPKYFEPFAVPLTQVSGVAILAWCFVLLSPTSNPENKNA